MQNPAARLQETKPLLRAAELFAELQHANGSFPIDGANQLGSPVTYGLCLSTTLAKQTLNRADAARFRERIERTEVWLSSVKCDSVLDAAAILLGLPATEKHAAQAAQRERCLALIRRGQSKDGGWGPYATSPPEAFDTALVLIALAREEKDEWKAAIRKGREFLIKSQRDDGSWEETTRPAGAESYAQRVLPETRRHGMRWWRANGRTRHHRLPRREHRPAPRRCLASPSVGRAPCL